MRLRKMPWPDASMRDRVLMVCGDWENGIDRDTLARETKTPGFVLAPVLAQLERDDWLHAEHPDGRPGRDSYYELNGDREGLEQLNELWFIEHGYVPNARELLAEQRVEKQPLEMGVAARAAVHAPDDLSAASGRRFRSLHVRAAREWRRGVEIWHLMDSIYLTGWPANERARDILHMHPDHRTDLPPQISSVGEESSLALALALACRKMAQEDAAKYRMLLHDSSAAYARAEAMAQVLDGGTSALDPFRPARGVRRREHLSAGVRMARASAALDNPGWQPALPTVGFAGEVAVAYGYRDMAKRLEHVAQEVLLLPELADAAQTAEFQQEMGEPPSFERADESWGGETRRLESTVELPSTELADAVPVEAVQHLRAGDVITAAGGREMTDPIVVVDVDRGQQTAYLAMPEASSAWSVPFSLLEYPDGLMVRRSASEVPDPLGEVIPLR